MPNKGDALVWLNLEVEASKNELLATRVSEHDIFKFQPSLKTEWQSSLIWVNLWFFFNHPKDDFCSLFRSLDTRHLTHANSRSNWSNKDDVTPSEELLLVKTVGVAELSSNPEYKSYVRKSDRLGIRKEKSALVSWSNCLVVWFNEQIIVFFEYILYILLSEANDRSVVKNYIVKKCVCLIQLRFLITGFPLQFSHTKTTQDH